MLLTVGGWLVAFSVVAYFFYSCVFTLCVDCTCATLLVPDHARVHMLELVCRYCVGLRQIHTLECICCNFGGSIGKNACLCGRYK